MYEIYGIDYVVKSKLKLVQETFGQLYVGIKV